MTDDAAIECAMRPVHPGEILREELVELGLPARAFARALDIPVNRVTQILREQRGVSADTALRLGRYFGTSPEFWMDLQSDYELRRAQREVGPAIAQRSTPARLRGCRNRWPDGADLVGSVRGSHQMWDVGTMRGGDVRTESLFVT
jgi:antitoxin HigA-1